MKLILILLCLCVTAYVQADVYKYINKQGKTAYSDVPIAGAKKIIIPPVVTFKAPVIPKRQVPVNEIKRGDAHRYKSLKITSPVEDDTVRNNEGIVNVAYLLKPSLRKGDRLVLFVDGKKQRGLTAKGIERGEHVLRLEVQSKNGIKRINSQRVSFNLHHQSSL